MSNSDDEARRGDGPAIDATLYAEMRRIAASFLRRERRNHTLEPTALVHEACLRLMNESEFAKRDSAHLRALAATAMRRILVDHARASARRSIPGGRRITLADLPSDRERDDPLEVDLLTLDDALADLAQRSERQARVVELRWFGGLGIEEIAQVVGVTDRTVKEDWRVARAWLRRELSRGESER